MSKVNKGDRVVVVGNEIFNSMGYARVTGTVFMIYPDNHGFALKCDQTGCMETVDFGDGEIQIAS